MHFDKKFHSRELGPARLCLEIVQRMFFCDMCNNEPRQEARSRLDRWRKDPAVRSVQVMAAQ
jgi:hypothetical protein